MLPLTNVACANMTREQVAVAEVSFSTSIIENVSELDRGLGSEIGNTDRLDGVVGVVGNALGKLKINIADMQVGRTQEGGQALMALTVDSLIPKEIIDVISKETGASLVRFVNLVNE